MATVSLAESAAPRDFQISVSSGSAQYSRCMLCAAGRRSFYCAECVASGNFVHSSAPYSERFAEKQLKLYRIRGNRKHVQERCEALLLGRSRQERMRIESNQCKEKIAILKLAIEETKRKVEEKKLQLGALTKYNGELQSKLPRYQKRVSSMEKHAFAQKMDLQRSANALGDTGARLAALRRARLRQLTQYIFPVHLTYDAQESLYEDDECLQDVKVVEQPDKMRNVNLHIVAASLPANGDYSKYTQWVWEHKDTGGGSTEQAPEGAEHPVYRISAGLSLAAQLTTLAASYLSVRLPYNLNFSDYCSGTMMEATLNGRVRRLYACLVWVCLHARKPPPPAHRHTLTLLHALCTAAATDDSHLGRVESCLSSEMVSAAEAWSAAWTAAGELELSDDEEPEPPEHLNWAADWDNTEEMSVISASPPQPPASLVTSAAASIASIWRGWTK